MKNNLQKVCAGLICLTLFGASNAPAATPDNPLAWPELTSQVRPWAWWWWHGSAVDTTNIDHELQRYHDAGLGGVQITSIYGTKGAEARDIPATCPPAIVAIDRDVPGNTAERI